jgi:anti-anti-sigma regulatory factor
MKRHLSFSTTGRRADEGSGADVTAARARGAVATGGHGRPRLTLLHTRPWRHTLILKGNLDQRSTAELEDEIDCLRQEGVTALTLDLRQLDDIDPRGAAVIASQSALFEGRGRLFDVLVESPGMHRVLAQAGGTHLLAPATTEVIARRFSGPSSHAPSGVSTTMVRELGLG